ncbi:MAG: TMEM175 family protein [Actinomycetota bacterium]|nr:TMEM175 family protein [Actinomycetota bacterium]
MVAPPEQKIEDSTRGLDRIAFFSDAVFAIAVTLLVLSIQEPQIPADRVAEELPRQLLDLWPQVFSYVISFLVIFSFWAAHHSIFSVIRGYDRRLLWLNALFLMFVAFLPFPTALMGDYGDQQLVVALYAGSMAITRLLLTAVWWYATTGGRLTDSALDRSYVRTYHIRGLIIPFIFLVSIGISFFSVRVAIYTWVLLLIGDFVALRLLRR